MRPYIKYLHDSFNLDMNDVRHLVEMKTKARVSYPDFSRSLNERSDINPYQDKTKTIAHTFIFKS